MWYRWPYENDFDADVIRPRTTLQESSVPLSLYVYNDNDHDEGDDNDHDEKPDADDNAEADDDESRSVSWACQYAADSWARCRTQLAAFHPACCSQGYLLPGSGLPSPRLS